MIELCGLTKKFSKKIALNHINYQFGNGVYGLLGPNGAGKTTLMRCIANLYELTSGDIRINNISIKKSPRASIAVGYLPQKFGVFQELTVNELMEYFSNLKKISRRNRKKEIQRCLEIVNLSEQAKVKASKLSGGMIRRVGIAQALLSSPQIIMFDEPTAGLDPEERMRFKNIIASIDHDHTIIISTHIVEDVEACCNHIVLMNDANILTGGSCKDIRNLAQNKICEMEKALLEDLKEPYYVEKQYEKEERIMCRVITTEAKKYLKLESTIEDGYLCLLKNI